MFKSQKSFSLLITLKADFVNNNKHFGFKKLHFLSYNQSNYLEIIIRKLFSQKCSEKQNDWYIDMAQQGCHIKKNSSFVFLERNTASFAYFKIKSSTFWIALVPETSMAMEYPGTHIFISLYSFNIFESFLFHYPFLFSDVQFNLL